MLNIAIKTAKSLKIFLINDGKNGDSRSAFRPMQIVNVNTNIKTEKKKTSVTNSLIGATKQVQSPINDSHIDSLIDFSLLLNVFVQL